MAALIYQLPTPLPGTVGILPQKKFMVSGDNFATITAAGYLNQINLESFPINKTDIINVLYNYNLATTTGTYEQFAVSITNGVITLTALSNAGQVTLPTIANHIAVYTNTGGNLSEDAATAINGGNIQAGLSGTAGILTSYPATASKGNLSLAAVNSAANYAAIISNASLGQATTWSLADPGAATANILNAGAALVNGNIVQASGTAGLVVDSGVAVANVMKLNAVNSMAAASGITLAKVNGTESGNAVTASGVAGVITTSTLTTAAAGSYAITWTNTFISSTSVVLVTIAGGTNTTESLTIKVAPGSGTATMTIYNVGPTNALNGTILISYLVM